MYKLTTCGTCGTDIMQDGCCGSEVIIYNCSCGEKYIEDLRNKNKKTIAQKEFKKCSTGDKK